MKLRILPRVDAPDGPITANDLIVLVDGREIDGLYGLTLVAVEDDVTRVALHATVDELAVDADVLSKLVAVVDADAAEVPVTVLQ